MENMQIYVEESQQIVRLMNFYQE